MPFLGGKDSNIAGFIAGVLAAEATIKNSSTLPYTIP